jgi:hypothetical protein
MPGKTPTLFDIWSSVEPLFNLNLFPYDMSENMFFELQGNLQNAEIIATGWSLKVRGSGLV